MVFKIGQLLWIYQLADAVNKCSTNKLTSFIHANSFIHAAQATYLVG